MPESLVIKPIAPQDTLLLRHALLRPHLTPETCVYPFDESATTVHLGAFIDEVLCGIISLYRKAGYRVGEEEFIVEGVGPHRIVDKDFTG